MTEASDTPVYDLLARMTDDSSQTSSLDEVTLFLVRLAALVSVNAPPTSYLMSLGELDDIDIDLDQVRGMLSAIAPIVGTPRVVEASGNMVEALGFALEVAAIEGAIDDALEQGLSPRLATDAGREIDG